MSTFKPYLSAIEAPSLADVQAWQGLTLLEFGTEWCGHCRAAQPLIAQALAAQPHWQHCKVEDGPGRAWAAITASSCGPPWCCCAMGRKWGDWCGLRPRWTLKARCQRLDGVVGHLLIRPDEA
jgi:hypothetical protein